MKYKICFGTDGWRGTIAEDFTFDNVRRCTQGFSSYLLDKGLAGKKIVVGYDKRFHSENFAKVVAEVLAGNDFYVLLTNGPMPTPVISYAVLSQNAVGAVNITASHNPPCDNGFKLRDQNGSAMDPASLKKIEAAIPKSVKQVNKIGFEEACELGLITIFDPAPAYIKHLNDLVNLKSIREAGLKIVVDAMWGNGAGWFSHLLSGGSTQVIEIHNERNPIYPEMHRPEPIRPNIDIGLKTAATQQADVLIILDGDADRVGIGDEFGNFINQLRVFALLAYYLLEVRYKRGAIVKALSATNMLEKLAAIYNVPIYEMSVGFKHIAPKMIETNALIGGEESGGYAFRDNVLERDGILAGLYFLDMMVKLRRKPSELVNLLFNKIGAQFYYDRIDARLDKPPKWYETKIKDARPATIGGLKVIERITTDGYKFRLENDSWLLIRFSGTEPIIRVYSEATKVEHLQAILEDGLRITGLS